MILYAQTKTTFKPKGQVKFMKANVKKHVIIGTLSAACIAMVCVIGTQFRSDIPSAENVAKESAEAEIKVDVVTNAKEEKESAAFDSDIINNRKLDETGEINYYDFIENGGVEVNQSFEEATKPQAPPAPKIDDKDALTNPSEPPKYESEQIEIKPQTTEPSLDTPQHGDKKEGMIYIEGFGWIHDEGGGSKSEYAGGMYENGNKIGFFG